MPGRPKAGSAASRRGRASKASQAASLALPKKIQAAAEDGKAGVVQTWLTGDGLLDATCVRGGASGWTLLLIAAANGHKQLVELLLKRGAKPDAQDSIGTTALMAAANNGHVRVVEALLEHGAEVNQRTKNGRTALMAASFFNHPAAVLVLLRAGREGCMARDEDGKTALQFAQQQGHEECIAAFRTYLEEEHEEGVANRRRREAAAEGMAQAATGGMAVAAGEAGDAGESLVPLLSNVTLEARPDSRYQQARYHGRDDVSSDECIELQRAYADCTRQMDVAIRALRQRGLADAGISVVANRQLERAMSSVGDERGFSLAFLRRELGLDSGERIGLELPWYAVACLEQQVRLRRVVAIRSSLVGSDDGGPSSEVASHCAVCMEEAEEYADIYHNRLLGQFEHLPLRIQWLMHRYGLVEIRSTGLPRWAGAGYAMKINDDDESSWFCPYKPYKHGSAWAADLSLGTSGMEQFNARFCVTAEELLEERNVDWRQELLELDPKRCSSCMARLAVNRMSKCSRCKAVRYCSRECQKRDWAYHKKYCNAVA